MNSKPLWCYLDEQPEASAVADGPLNGMRPARERRQRSVTEGTSMIGKPGLLLALILCALNPYPWSAPLEGVRLKKN